MNILETSLSPIPFFAMDDVNVYDHTDPYQSITDEVIVLDMDLTLISVEMQSDIWNLRYNLKWNDYAQENLPSCDHSQLVLWLLQGCLRPGVVKFIKYLREMTGHTIVIYTYSAEDWAERVTDALSEIVGYKFFSVLLSRESCASATNKSLHKVVDALEKKGIKRTLKNITMYDDRNVCPEENLELVPVYRYVLNEDLLSYFPPHIVNLGLDTYEKQKFIQSLIDWKYANKDYLEALGHYGFEEQDTEIEEDFNDAYLSDNYFVRELEKY